MSNYIPVYMHPDRMPVDISFIFEDERPAGKHGFCQAKGDNMYFEDGTLAKFWGVMMNGGACFPPHDRAEAVAQRLSHVGVNIVRLHQMDDEWVTPNFYRLTAGKRLENTRELCEECMERLDYFIKCLKDRGIYVNVDMTTYRRFKPGDGVRDAHLLHDGARLYSLYDPVMIELQKEFCDKFWNHFNPYTGLKYKDDPIFVACCLFNENDTMLDHSGGRWYHRIPYYENMLRDMFDEWLKEKGIEYDAYGCDFFTKDTPMVQFRMHLMEKYCHTMRDYLRSLGVKIPISGSNFHTTTGIAKAQENMDFHEGHTYYYDWSWGEKEKVAAHRTITSFPTCTMGAPGSNRVHGKPFFITEWDMPFPNSFRAEGALWFPAVACLQNWTGMTNHTYGYGHEMSKYDLLGKAASTSTIGGVPYREGIFAVWNDPAKFGQYYHGALMFRRGDVSPANKVLGAKIEPEMYHDRANALAVTGMETHQIHTVFDTTDVSDGIELRDPNVELEREDPFVIVSDNGQLKRDIKKEIGYIDTPKTKSIYGRIGFPRPNRRAPMPLREVTDMTVRSYTDFAAITMSALDKNDLVDSGNILLTTVGRARNRGAQFDGDKMVDYGTGPIEIEVIQADITLRTTKEILEVWAVDSDGFYSGRVDSVIEDGVLKFTVGREFACMYYLILEP